MTANALGMLHQLPKTSAGMHTATENVATNSQSNSSTEDSISIAANDFLTLLVTEMKNQDPTATTDPNEWVNQLVQVNSLQQLISINETLKQGTAAKTEAAPGKTNEGSAFDPMAAMRDRPSDTLSAAAPNASADRDFRSAALHIAAALSGK